MSHNIQTRVIRPEERIPEVPEKFFFPQLHRQHEYPGNRILGKDRAYKLGVEAIMDPDQIRCSSHYMYWRVPVDPEPSQL